MVRLLCLLPVRTNVVFPGERILHLGTKTSKPAESKVVELESKNLFSRPVYSGNGTNGIICGFLVLSSIFLSE